MVWSKALIQERERFDGADVMHILLHRAESMDWTRLLARFGERWPLLYAYLVYFTFVFPSETHRLPAAVLDDLGARFQALRASPSTERVCQGTLVSREQYLIDVGQHAYADARLSPRGGMSAEDAIYWTWAIGNVK